MRAAYARRRALVQVSANGQLLDLSQVDVVQRNGSCGRRGHRRGAYDVQPDPPLEEVGQGRLEVLRQLVLADPAYRRRHGRRVQRRRK
eukprot:982928-Prymnesium_polylepis.1